MADSPINLSPGGLDMGDVESPLWWVNRLSMRLLRRRPRYEKMARYYRGEHILPEADKRTRDAFLSFQRKARANYMKMVVDSVHERLWVTGFRTGSDGSSDTDEDAWKVWQANHLDADQGLVHIAALKYPDAYVLVGPPPAPNEGDEPDDGRTGKYPVITVEDPRQMIGEADPLDRRRMRAALKTWVDDDENMRYGILYLPETIYYFKSDYPSDVDTINRDEGVGRAPYISGIGQWQQWKSPVPNPLNAVPVVRFVAQPMEDGEGIGEFEDLIDVQDRINDTVLNRMIVQKAQAYAQRWVKGLNTKDENGNDIDLPFVPGVDMLWAVEDEDVEFGQFPQSTINPFLDAVRSDLQELVIRASLPPTYVMGDLVNVSADSVAAIEERLVAKCFSRATQIGESWEQVMRLAFTYMGQMDRIGPDAEVQWRDFRRNTPSTLSSAAQAMNTVGVPFRWIMESLGYSPTDIDRMEAAKLQQQMTSALLTPPPPPQVAPGAPQQGNKPPNQGGQPPGPGGQ